MPKLNPYLIENKENKKSVETIYELKSEIPSLEEFMKNYENDKAISRSYEAEYQDRILHGPQYGPGNEQSKNVAKKLGSLALAASYFTPAVVITGPLTAGVAVGGATTWTVGQIADDKEAIDVGGAMFGFALGAAADGVSGSTASTVLAQGAKVIAKGVNIYNEAQDIKDGMKDGVYIPSQSLPSARQVGEISTLAIKNLL